MAPQGPMTGHCKMFIEKTNDCNKATKNNLKRKVKEGKASEEEKQKIAALEEKLQYLIFWSQKFLFTILDMILGDYHV